MTTGYFISMQIDNNVYSSTEFMQKRFMGIYPMYWMVAACCAFLNLSYFHNYPTTSGFWRSFLLIAGDNNTLCKDEWTLYLQVLFYVIAAVFFYGKLRRIYPYLLTSGFIILTLYNSYIQTNMSGATYDVLIKSVPLGWVLLGGVIYYASKHLKLPNIQIPMPCAILLLVIYTLVYDIIRDKPGYICVPIYYLLTAGTFVAFKNVKTKKTISWLCFLSTLSYPIYLLHPTVYTVLFSFVVATKNIEWNPVLQLICVIFAFFVCVAVSYIIKKFLDGRLNK